MIDFAKRWAPPALRGRSPASRPPGRPTEGDAPPGGVAWCAKGGTRVERGQGRAHDNGVAVGQGRAHDNGVAVAGGIAWSAKVHQ
jgi:hypothetical protein